MEDIDDGEEPGPSSRRNGHQPQPEPPVEDLSSMSMSSDEEINITPYELIQRIFKGWQNEKLSPELLYPMVDEIECMLGEIKVMDNNLTKMKLNDPRFSIHKHEIARIKYIISSYLRTRLAKIQEQCWFLIDEEQKIRPGEASRVSPEELKFLKEYIKLLESQLTKEALEKFPQTLQKFDRKKMMISPSLDRYVFIKVVKNIGNIVIENSEGVSEDLELLAGSTHVVRYRFISRFISAGAVVLL